MKQIILLTAFIFSAEMGFGACGPDYCCGRPRLCGRGPETEQFQSTEKNCLDRAAYSVRGSIAENPDEYPRSVLDQYGVREAAKVSWIQETCQIKYNAGYFGSRN